MSNSWVHAGGWLGTDLVDITSDLSALDSDGRWFLVAPFEGPALAARMARWEEAPLPTGVWPGATHWQSDFDEADYCAGVEAIQARIAQGDVYQVNLCRRLFSQWPTGGEIAGLAGLLAQHNPAPHSATVSIQDERLSRWGLSSLEIASASPELFLHLENGKLCSQPIKGTTTPGGEFLEKDQAENIMIVDLVRNDLSACCIPGTVEVEHLLERQLHPGLDHLVSTVCGQVQPEAGWSEIFGATFPPGSVTGAPKSSAVKLIGEMESRRRYYCGSLGIIDADAETASLNVAIRTFWREGDQLWFGAGSGITWGSDPVGEWQESELKAHRLIEIASGSVQ